MPATPAAPDYDLGRQLAAVRRAVTKRSFAVLATSSAQNRPHAVGLLYAAVDLTLYFLVGEESVKVRNIRQNAQVAVSIPVRLYPFAPPMAVQYQGTAEILGPADPGIKKLTEAGKLKKITGLGAGDKPGICYIKVTPGRRINSYGVGVPLRRLLKDVSAGARSIETPR